MKLIDDFGKIWPKLWSVQVSVAGALLAAADQALPMLGALEEGFLPKWAYVAIFLLAALSRGIKQRNVSTIGDRP